MTASDLHTDQQYQEVIRELPKDTIDVGADFIGAI